MQQVRDGDVGKLSLLFDHHHKPLLRFFVHLTSNHEASEDLVQEVFFRVLKYRQSFQPGTSFRAWLYQIARNAHIDQAGKHKLETVLPENIEFRAALSGCRTNPCAKSRTPNFCAKPSPSSRSKSAKCW